ncbi:MAG: ABC transporter permease subunit [Bacteriovoracales bacterium]|nr:ABC transporter permease subunit [Bacteriovoracales bacterium]
MIERLIKNEISLKRYRIFKRNKIAVFSLILFLLFNFFSFTAEIWANNKPLIMSYREKIYFPVLFSYHPEEFGIKDTLIVDYRSLNFSDRDWSLWPIIKWNPFEKNEIVESYPSPPSGHNFFGTDDRGRDVFTRLLYGLRYSMIYALLVWAFSFALGTMAGGIMGYFGGRIDFWGQRAVEVLTSVPQFFLLLIIISIFRPNLFWLILVSCLFGWISISYYSRGEFLKNRKREYVEAAKSIGVKRWKIITYHILPNSLTPLITFTPFVIATNITALASLDYLGFGLEIPTPSWGELLGQAQKNFTIAWWLAFYPALALFLTLTMLNLVGDGLRDAMDPHKT